MTTYTDTIAALSVCLSAGEPVVLWGAPGCGKTAVLESLAVAQGWPCETVIASVREPSDFAGLPVVAGDGTVRLAPPAWAQRIATAGEGLVFFDEITTAPPSVQAALLRPLTDRWVGDVRLPEATRFVLAANPPEIATDGWELSAPLANRMVHLEWSVPGDVIADGLARGFTPIEVPTVQTSAVAREEQRARVLVGGFLHHRRDLVSAVPASQTDAGRSYPTPRTWEKVARLLGHAWALGVGEGVNRALLAGTIGSAAAIEFLQWQRALDLPDPEDILGDPTSFVVPSRPDYVHPIASSLLVAITDLPTTARAAAMEHVLVAFASAGHVDAVFTAASGLAKLRVNGWAPGLPFVTAFAHLLAALGDLRAA
ncbi:AAA family ATPase [Nocardioides sp. P5_E3]